MSGAGSQHDSYEPLQKALEAHAKEASGAESYVLGDWVLIGYVVNLEQSESENEGGEYIMASSSKAPHIVEGLLSQIHLFQHNSDDDD